ncbi:MAG TPA: sugar phosphate nucleotidyltransferase [bacterium]|nr:sugar phosphate nucleotidyltransferase [bacterium]
MTARPRALIVAAGVGRRLGRHTARRPKPLVYVAGRPILAHLLDALPPLGVTDVVVVAGYLRGQIEEYLAARPGASARVVVQAEPLGNGHAVYAARDHLEGPVLIQFGDTIPRLDLGALLAREAASIAVAEVDDPRGYGIVEVDDRGRVRRLWEKPAEPRGRRAVAGTFYFPDAGPLREALDEMVRRDARRAGEFWLVDAVQHVIDRGIAVETFPVDRFYDCGTVDTVLLANRELLAANSGLGAPETRGADVDGESVIVPPVAIAPGAVIREARIGPYVTVAPGARIVRSRLRDAIVHPGAVLEGADVAHEIVDEPVVACGGG